MYLSFVNTHQTFAPADLNHSNPKHHRCRHRRLSFHRYHHLLNFHLYLHLYYYSKFILN